jgi:diadenosine tetraphosphate (Ap4A) HIT family hydrolase
MSEQPCEVCNRVNLWRSGANPYFIHEFTHSVFVVGDHQYHRGYSLLLLKNHVRELHELSPTVQAELFSELMTAGMSVVAEFQPWKMNYACYGNKEEHVHWHLFPRYDTEPDHRRNPWTHCDKFDSHTITAEEAQALSARLRNQIPLGGTPGGCMPGV